jgi:hypothetical protein
VNGNVKMGLVQSSTFNTGQSAASGNWTGWFSACSGSGYVISANCWMNNHNYMVPVGYNGGSIMVMNPGFTGNTESFGCSVVCANMR